MMQKQTYSWSTHLPLLQAVLELYKPTWVLESGTGVYSTELLSQLEYIGIENNEEWYSHLSEKFPKLNIKYHALNSRIKGSLHIRGIKQVEQRDIAKYYQALELPEKGLGFLFVDGYACTRSIVINTLQSKFDLIAYHDCSPRSRKYYAYENLKVEGFTTYYLTSPTSWTALLVRNDKGLEKLVEVAAQYITKYKKQYPECKEMEVIRG